MVDHFRKSRVENIIISRACGVIVVIFNTVDGQIIQTPHPWVVGYPLSPQISTLWFRIFVPDLRVWFISSIRERTKPKKTLKLGVRGVSAVGIALFSSLALKIGCPKTPNFDPYFQNPKIANGGIPPTAKRRPTYWAISYTLHHWGQGVQGVRGQRLAAALQHPVDCFGEFIRVFLC